MPETSTRRYFWIMTVHTDGTESTLKNTCDVAAGTTRDEVYDSIRAFVAEQIGRSDFVTAFFHLAPNEL
ncbi:hypothetical protein HW130_03120 [Streptomyces sp. PKU-EA00015]|uniref:hypothetical protein n=1 Tax=Streptomyces sp. PKU-EA00015 TaxID=2748326 RepID=UPI0015A1E6C0|nr:hypothetical protein [Streptomyces sp. PKU-EA00015]NWF25263.1 hypothetical protein [Streptomyces sp. PKU-EA00015]